MILTKYVSVVALLLGGLVVARRGLRVLDVVDCEMNEEEDDDEVFDWVAAFPRGPTDLESLCFECFTPQVPFAALEALVARSPRLRRLGVNQHVSLGQLRRLMALTPRLTHLGTGSFRPGDGAEDEGLDLGQILTAFSSAGRANTLVSLSGFRDLAREYLLTIATVAAANLTSLDLSYAPVTPDQVLPFIVQCCNLETLWVLTDRIAFSAWFICLRGSRFLMITSLPGA